MKKACTSCFSKKTTARKKQKMGKTVELPTKLEGKRGEENNQCQGRQLVVAVSIKERRQGESP